MQLSPALLFSAEELIVEVKEERVKGSDRLITLIAKQKGKAPRHTRWVVLLFPERHCPPSEHDFPGVMMFSEWWTEPSGR